MTDTMTAIRRHAEATSADRRRRYRELLERAAVDELPPSEAAAAFELLHAVGKTADDFEADVKIARERIRLASLASGLDEARVDFEVAADELRRIEARHAQERYDVTVRHDAELEAPRAAKAKAEAAMKTAAEAETAMKDMSRRGPFIEVAGERL